MKFLTLGKALALSVVVLGFVARGTTAAERPNFLFIYTDDQRWDALGVVQREQGKQGRFPWLETPHLDRLAAEGVRFRNAFVVYSLCSPSRATYLTGLYPHEHNVCGNATPFPVESVTWASLLRKAGYRTGYVGKWHMGDKQTERPGFDFSASYLGHGRYQDATFYVNEKNPKPVEGWVDDAATDFALEFITENKEKPWALVIGFKTPHGPAEPPKRTAELYASEKVDRVPNLKVTAPYLKKSGSPGADYIRDYLRCVSAVDQNVGKLMKKLDSLKLADNTMVIFCSDNGYYFGEHGLKDKRSAYDEALRIPLLVRYPKLVAKERKVEEMALNVDIAPTILDVAGISVPPAMQGRSLRPLLAGETVEWRKLWFYEYFKVESSASPTVLAVRTENAKLIQYPGHEEWTELFDLKTDPYETKNLAQNPEHKELLDSLRKKYDKAADAVDFKTPSKDKLKNTPDDE